MTYQQNLMSKNGLATMALAKEFIKYEIGDRVPTVSEFTDSLGFARGTIQNALKNMTLSNAITVESKGHLGSYLIKKDMRILLETAGINNLVGAMPLPYSKKYEGLASGLVSAMENYYNLPIVMSYMRGAKNRIDMVVNKRYDFAIVSKFAADQYMNDNDTIKIVKSFGEGSYCSKHVLIFHDSKVTEISDGMRVGVDNDSIDQQDVIRKECEGKNVEFIPVEYSTLLSRIIEGNLDATIWNLDEVLDKGLNMNWKESVYSNPTDTEAVIIVSKEREEMFTLLDKIISVKNVLNFQQLVVDGKITPKY